MYIYIYIYIHICTQTHNIYIMHTDYIYIYIYIYTYMQWRNQERKGPWLIIAEGPPEPPTLSIFYILRPIKGELSPSWAPTSLLGP